MSIQNTISPSNAAERCWDVIVIGAGPGGALLAALLARSGKQVLLVDKGEFPRHKVCGCCLNGTSLAVLERCGLGSLVSKLGGSRNGQLQIAARGRVIKTPLETSVSVSRFAMDAALVEHAIAAGSDFLGNALVRSCVLADSGDAVHVGAQAEDARLTAKIAVIANGLGSSLGTNQNGRIRVADNSWLGAGGVFTDKELIVPSGTIWMTCGEGGYVGVVRVEDDRVAVAAALDPNLIETAGGIGNAVARIFSDAKRDLFPFDWNRLDWRGTPLLTRQADSVAQNRIFAIGDATGYIEPFTGEGMGWAMQSAVALHPLVLKGVDRWDDDLADQWSRDHRRLIVKHQRFCRFVAGWLRRPWAVSSAAAIFSVAPFLIRPLIARVQSASNENQFQKND